MKIGLVTFYHIHHYGALLQACATERAVEALGGQCEIIDYYVNQNNALFQAPKGLGSAAHDAHTALHYGPLKARTAGSRPLPVSTCASPPTALRAWRSCARRSCPTT